MDEAEGRVTQRRRLLVALVLDGSLATEIDGLRRALRSSDLGRIAPHITIVPPTNVRGVDGVAGALEAMREAAHPIDPIEVGLGPPATFAPTRAVVYLAVDDATGDVAHLADRSARGALQAPLGRDQRPFVPHVTLGRPRPEEIPAVVSSLEGYVCRALFSQVHLLEERPFLERRSAWAPIASAFFGFDVVVGRGGREVRVELGSLVDPLASAFLDQAPVHPSPVAPLAGASPPSSADRLVLVAYLDGAIVGVAAARVGRSALFLERLFVDAAHRREGIGTILVSQLERLASARGAARLCARLEGGEAAGAFLRSRGFVAPRTGTGRPLEVPVRSLAARRDEGERDR